MTRLTVLCMCLNANGHVNATLGVAFALRKRGHRVVFATERNYEGFFKRQGFEEELYDEKMPQTIHSTEGEWNEWALNNLQYVGKQPIESFPMLVNAWISIIDFAIYCNSRIEEIVKTVKPNVIIEDRVFVALPAFITSGVAVVKLISGNPLQAFDDEKVPPGFFGLPTTDKTEWQYCRKLAHYEKQKQWHKIEQWYTRLQKATNCEFPKLNANKEYRSANLNILVYPEALFEDYLKNFTLPTEFMRLDHSIRESHESFDIPDKFKNGNGKLIYFSLGSLASSITPLIKRFIDMMSQMNHRFIASVGTSISQLELPENVYGASHIPQLQVLPLVDLVITHGGNNTFIETLYFGKPMIILPLFVDQFDNAQRAKEMNIAISLNPLTVTGDELMEAINSLSNDEHVQAKLKNISEQIQGSRAMDKVIDKIEFVAKFPKLPLII